MEQWLQVKEQMAAMNTAVANMEAFQKTSVERIAENEKNPTVSHQRLQAEWGKTFLTGYNASSPSSILDAHEDFDKVFSVFAKQRGPSLDTIQYAGIMHERLSVAASNHSATGDTATKIRALLEKTELYLVENAPRVAEQQVALLGASALSNYSDISYESSRTRCAAMAQALATKFAPNPSEDTSRAQRIEEQFSRVQAGMAVGPSTDDKPMAMLVEGSVHESVVAGMRQAMAAKNETSLSNTEFSPAQ